MTKTIEHPQKTYDNLLNNSLAKINLVQEYDFYLAGDETSYMPAYHRIVKIEEETQKIFGIRIPFTGKKSTIAKITSEPKQLGSICDAFSHLKYDGLVIEVLDRRFKNQIEKVCSELEKSLNEPVKLIA